MSKVITPRNEDYSKWYLDVATEAGLAEKLACPRLHDYKTLWLLPSGKTFTMPDARFKATGHVNASFPLLIPKSFLSKEADHIEGFAKECAVVTHYRLKKDPNGKGVIVDPEAKLEEELIIRPTSETIIWNTFSKPDTVVSRLAYFD